MGFEGDLTLHDFCRDEGPNLELLELQHISQQLRSLLGRCGGTMQPSDPGFSSVARSLLKLLEHLLVFPMATRLLNDANIILPVHECSQVRNASLQHNLDLPWRKPGACSPQKTKCHP